MKVVAPAAKPKVKSGPSAGNASDELRSRRSEELIIALSGPVGCGIPSVKDTLEEALSERGYQVVHIKVSSAFEELAQRHTIQDEEAPPNVTNAAFLRIWRLQTLGNKLRTKLGDDMGAQLAIKAISLDRGERHPNKQVPDVVPEKVAYIIDQLKHPKEVALLRSVYDNMLYVVGVLSGFGQRKDELKKSMPEDFAVRLMHRDRAETHDDKSKSDNNGQQLERTLKLADFFVSNSRRNIGLLKEPIKRFVGLVHGDTGLTPTAKECGMYAAYSAGLRSACLSRQVGAAIVDRFGNIISTGCNDVPRAGGGLYDTNSYPDNRCFHKEGLCFNDKHKNMLRDEVVETLQKAGNLDFAEAVRVADAIRSGTRIKDLIEFSRAVHAEMDAIIQSARRGNPSIQGSFLFTTTYPCHSCARHIVAAGIRAVYFIEPYEKSLALDLHDDSIDHEPSADADWNSDAPFDKVAFLHFEGVAPARFASLFFAMDGRKDSEGRLIKNPGGTNSKRVTEFLDNYKDLEMRVLARLESIENAGSGLPPEEPKIA
ncbi:deoxycytidylate deaminase [Dyella solisilvae]|uniref:Deoxycytidylate deaminase n=2 Tax=Dyella solisilvae TaxID=1920168 RepID=A0A370K345_9GAMM|nr:deoxycytidylate deaminase [Dyella solisilvae]